MKISLTGIAILLINIVIAQSPTKPTKEQTIQYIQNNLQGAVGVVVIDTTQGRDREMKKVESIEFSFDKVTLGWIELNDKTNPGVILREEQSPIPWGKLFRIEIDAYYSKESGYKTDFVRLLLYFSIKEIKHRFYSPNSNYNGFNVDSSIKFPVMPSKVEGLKKAFLRLSEIAKEEKELF